MRILVLGAAVLFAILASCAFFTFGYARWIEWRYPPIGRFLDVDGRRLHYVDTGAPGGGRGTVVLLHGASSNLAESMLGLGAPLSGRYRVIAFDRPGHGWSERGADPAAADPAAQAAVIATALRRLGVANAVVVGHSWSGAVVPHFALDHRDVAGAVLILSGVTYPWPGGEIDWYNRLAASWTGWLLTRTLVVPLGLALFPSATAHTFAPQAAPADFADAARLRLVLRPSAFEANAEDIVGLYGAVTRQSPRYGAIRMPSVVIGGDSDDIVRTDIHSRAFARDVPGAELVVLPGTGHMPQYAFPDIVLSKIEALAARIAPGPGAAR